VQALIVAADEQDMKKQERLATLVISKLAEATK
jgi:hypothetical protein